MTKSLNSAKITVETEHERYEFANTTAAIGSLDGGRTHFMSSGECPNMKKTPKLPYSAGGWSNANSTYAPHHTKPVEEQNLIFAARAQERATLRAARLIEVAQEQAEAVINDADHTLNMAIQAYQHTGKSALDTDRVLDSAGIYSNERRTENVATLNTEDLYLLDATELLTVG